MMGSCRSRRPGGLPNLSRPQSPQSAGGVHRSSSSQVPMTRALCYGSAVSRSIVAGRACIPQVIQDVMIMGCRVCCWMLGKACMDRLALHPVPDVVGLAKTMIIQTQHIARVCLSGDCFRPSKHIRQGRILPAKGSATCPSAEPLSLGAVGSVHAMQVACR